MPEVRIGDMIDDHCSHCHRITDHNVVSLLEGAVKKTRCRTCDYEHDYRHARSKAGGKTKLSAFDQVLASMPGIPAKTEKSSARPRAARRAPK